MHFKKIVEICEDYPHQGLSRRMAGQEDFRISTIVRPGLIRRGVSLWVAAVIMMRLKVAIISYLIIMIVRVGVIGRCCDPLTQQYRFW